MTEYHAILTLAWPRGTGMKVVTVEGIRNVPTGATRQDVFRDLVAQAEELVAAQPGDAVGVHSWNVLQFSCEPNVL